MKKIIFTEKAPAPIGPYSQAILIGNTLYTSGQIALDPATGELKTATLAQQTQLVMQNLKAVLEAADMDFSHVVKTSIFLTNMADFAEVNTHYAAHFDEATAPARETVQVAGLPKGVDVEISMVAVR